MKYTRLFAILLALILSACQTPAPTQPPSPSLAPTETAVPATPTATTPPPRALTVCLGQEPETLYRYAGSSRAMWSILEAVYDGPIDTVGYEAQPVILSRVPSFSSGDAAYRPVAVKAGDEVVNSSGEMVTLQAGERVFPAGCSSADCSTIWDGQSELQMDQLVIQYELLPGVRWSDGEALTADDSVYAFQLAADPATPASKRLVDRTASYEAPGEFTVVWTGKPGFRSTQVASFFWAPLPQHAWGDRSAAELLTAEDVNRAPLGWGPYVVQEWIPGDHLTLQRNSEYFRAAENLPAFDTLTYRFTGAGAEESAAALQNGQCDLVDPSAISEDILTIVRDLDDQGKIQVQVAAGPEWEQAAFGIRLAAYDAGYNIYGNHRQDLFGDVRVRQAFAYCLDRAGLVDQLQAGYGPVANNLLPPDHPDAAGALPQYPYDPPSGIRLLEEAGWVDHDNDPATARQALNVTNVLNGTPLAVNYLTTNAFQRQAAATYLTESLGACGIQATPVFMSTEDLYSNGPVGPLFGRSFDLAQFSWQASSTTPCFLYESSQIPAQANNWLGVNVTGYSSPEYDAACEAAKNASPEQENYRSLQAAVQQQFMQDLPVVPLYYHLVTAAARPDLCGLQVDASARSALWNLESLDYGEGCP